METSKLTFVNQLMMSVIGILIILSGIISNISVILYKKRYVKEDLITIEKFSLQIICLMYFIIVSINDLLNINELNTYFITDSIIMIYCIGKSLLNLYLSIEGYRILKKPFYVLESYVYKNVKNFLFEIILITIITSFICLNYCYLDIDEIYLKENIAFLLTNNIYTYILSFVILLSSLIILIVKYIHIKNCIMINYSKPLYKNKIEIISTLIEIITISLSIYVVCYEKMGMLYYFNYFLLTMNFIENILYHIIISNTDYYFYTLGNSNLSIFFKMYSKNIYKKPSLDMEYNSTFIGNRDNYIIYFHDKLNFYVEEYQIGEIEHEINISLASIYLILHLYDTEIRKSKNSNDSSNKVTDIIYFQSIANNYMKFSNRSIIREGNKSSTYTFIKNKIENDFSNVDEKIIIEKMVTNDNPLKNTKDLKVELNVFNQYEFLELMHLKTNNDIISILKNSLISHINNNVSFFLKNIKDDNFKRQTRLLFKTYDKQFNIEIIDQDLSDCEDFLMTYVNYMKNNKKSFLPIILGAFSIKINNYSRLNIVISKNKILENVPKEYFNYWQLMKINQSGIKMITSSKDRISYLIQDDMMVLKQESKLIIANFIDFQKILENDINFFKNLRIKGFSMYVMYYEFGKLYQNTSSTDNDRIFSIGNTNLRPSKISKDISDIKGSNDNSLFDITIRQELSFIQDNIGFEASINDFKCIIFFLFDDIYMNKSNYCYSGKYYDKYFRNVTEKFDESILK